MSALSWNEIVGRLSLSGAFGFEPMAYSRRLLRPSPSGSAPGAPAPKFDEKLRACQASLAPPPCARRSGSVTLSIFDSKIYANANTGINLSNGTKASVTASVIAGNGTGVATFNAEMAVSDSNV